MEPAISAIATLTCSGTANPSPAGVSILSFWYFLVTAVPCFEAVSWRTPHTYLTVGAGGGPPPPLLRDPGQPPPPCTCPKGLTSSGPPSATTAAPESC